MSGEHPPPPDNFEGRHLPTTEVRGPLWRISRKKYDNHLYSGSSGDYRFDAPDGQFGVCYVANDFHGAFIEVFGRSIGLNLVTEEALELHEHPHTSDGIRYRSRHDPSRFCTAAFDRVSHVLSIASSIGFTDTRCWSELLTILEHYEFALS